MASYFDSFRDIYQRVTITNTGDVIVGGLVSITISQVTSSDRTLKMGEFCKNSVKIIYRGEAMPWQGSKVQVDSVLSGVATPMGVFFVDKVEFDGVKYTITGYDLPASMDDEYDVSNGLTDSVDIEAYILEKTGTFIDSDLDSFTVESVPEGTTNRQMLGYLYGCMGKNLRMNRSGTEIETYWYTFSYTQIPRSAQYQNQLRKDMDLVTLTSLLTGTQDNRIEYGSGFGITFWNPYITEEQANSIYNSIYGNQYYVGTVKYRGNPEIMCGDYVRVELADGTWATMYVMSQEFKCDGGMNATITSYGNPTTTAVINKNNVDNKIQALYSDFRNALQHALDVLKNSPDGYFTLLTDADGNYTGWQITNSPGAPDIHTSGWRWTYGGLAWTSDGFNSVNNIAITNDGRIVAKYIDGLVITADMFESSLAQEFNQAVANAQTAVDAAETISQWFTFDSTNGLIIGDTQDPTKSSVAQVKADGFRIMSPDLATELFSAVVGDSGESEVTATNLIAKNYLVLKQSRNGHEFMGRFEPYGDSYDAYQIGFYFQDEGVS